jgi:predicted RNA-binding Zn-ribbon protein involved in translation (DUF1610 family)
MNTFNRGKPFHGSDKVQGGRLRGATDTDYFYFFCPQCPNDQIVRILDYGVVKEAAENRYNEIVSPKAAKSFTLGFKIHCPKCGLTDFVKISNEGWQGGTHAETLRNEIATH